MTAIRAQEEQRTILDFSHGKCSKNKIKQALDSCYLTSIEEIEENEVKFYLNTIKVGMYFIKLQLPVDLLGPRTLKEFHDFEVNIYDDPDSKAKRIDLKKDTRFKHQEWVRYNFFGMLRVKHMVDIISHCQRLDRLKAFL